MKGKTVVKEMEKFKSEEEKHAALFDTNMSFSHIIIKYWQFKKSRISSETSTVSMWHTFSGNSFISEDCVFKTIADSAGLCLLNRKCGNPDVWTFFLKRYGVLSLASKMVQLPKDSEISAIL